MKKVTALFLAVIMLVSLAACGSTGGGSTGGGSDHEFTSGYDETKYNAPGTLPIFKETQTISVTLPDSVYVEDWETNFQTYTLEEDLNADLLLSIMPSKEYKTKLNLIAAGGGSDFTDVVLGSFKDEEIYNYAEAGVALPLTEYYYNKDISWNIWEAFDRLGFDFLKQITMADGEIYGVGKLNDTKSLETPIRQYIYLPWCEKLGIDIDEIHTRDDYRDALKKIVTSDPNGNGKADEVGIIGFTGDNNGWFEYIMNTFVYAGDDNYMLVENGDLSFAFTRDEWKEGLKYMNEMFKEGLISELNFTQDKNAMQSMLNTEDVICASFNYSDTSYVYEGDPRRVEYEGLAPLNSDYVGGRQLASFSPNVAQAALFVTNQAQDPEVGFRLGDYMCSLKMSIAARFGEEGVDWLRPQEGDVALYAGLGYEPYLKPILVWATKQNKHWYQTGPLIREDAIVSGQVWTGDPYDAALAMVKAQAKYRGKGPDEYITKLLYDGEEEFDVITQYLSAIIDYVDEFTAKAVTGAVDIDAEWDGFITRLSQMNMAEVLEVAQRAYTRYVEI